MSAAVHGFAEDAGPIRRLAARLGVPAGWIDLHEFPDGEVLPTARPGPARTVILYRSLYRPDVRLIPLLLAADGFRRAGVTRLVLVAPYLCYLRQDSVFEPGQPLSRDVIGGWIGHAFERVVTVQAHMHRTACLSDVFGASSDNLDIAGDLAQATAGDDRPLVVGPDEESQPWVQAAAARLGARAVTFRKRRFGDHSVALDLPADLEVAGRSALLLDDVCSTGATLELAIRRLREAGAASVDVAVAHALFDAEAHSRLLAAGARRIVSSESAPHPTNALDLDGVLAAALQDEV